MEKSREGRSRKRKTGFYVGGLIVIALGSLFAWQSYVLYRHAKLQQPLFAAIQEMDTDAVARLLARGADPNARNRPRTQKGFLELLQRLFTLRQKEGDENFETALMAAADKADTETVTLLLRKGADVHAVGPGQMTALHRAAAVGADEVTAALLSGGADPNRRAKGGDTPLIVAIRDGHGTCVSVLVDRGANPNLVNNARESPMLFAAELGLPNLYRPLLKNGADPNTRDRGGSLLLTRAIESGREDLVELLLHYHANPNVPQAFSPLMTALTKKRSERYDEVLFTDKMRLGMVRRLLEAKADPNVKNPEGCPALWQAVHLEHTEEVALLLKAGAGPNAPHAGTPPLIQAAFQHNTAMVKSLLASKATPDLKGEGGMTALMVAAFNGENEMVRALLAAGAHPQIKDAEGLDAFQCAIGSPQTVALLHKASGVSALPSARR